MATTFNTTLTRRILLVMAWVIFAGLGIDAGGIIVYSIGSLVTKAGAPVHFWQAVDLSNLLAFDRSHFITLVSIMTIVAVVKTVMFYFIVRILHDNRLNIVRPFNRQLTSFVVLISYLSMVIGLFSLAGTRFTEWLAERGTQFPTIESLRLGGGDVWLFMSVTLFVIAVIFKRGIEIQEENDLTV